MRIAARAIGKALGMIPLGRAHREAIIALALLMVLAAVSFASAAKLDAGDFKMAGDATRMRVVMHFDVEPELRWFLLRGPHRLVIELPETRFVFEPKALKARGLIRKVSYGAIGGGESRVVFATKGPFEVEQAEVIQEEDGSGFRTALISPPPPTANSRPPLPIRRPPPPGRRSRRRRAAASADPSTSRQNPSPSSSIPGMVA